MKKLLLSLLLFSAFANAQPIVNIPDPVFKAELIAKGIDTNADGEIQHAEAQAVQQFTSTNSLITNVTGIEAFTNLTALVFSQMPITALDVSGMTQLTYLVCTDTQVSFLAVENLTQLTHLECRGSRLLPSLAVGNLTNLVYLDTRFCNLITSLNVTPLVNLQTLVCAGNNISSLNTTPLIHLKQLDIANCPISAVDITQMPGLEQFYCDGTGLTTLDISVVPNLSQLSFNNTQISTIDLSPVNLTKLYCRNTPLTTIDVSQQTNLNTFDCGSSQLTGVDLSNLPNLNYLDIVGSLQSEINVTNSPLLVQVNISNTAITEIDFSYNPELMSGSLDQNDNLVYLNTKNGFPNLHISINSCPNLIRVCANEESIGLFESYFDPQTTEWNNNNPLCQVNSYCSFTPGGAYNTIRGKVRFDFNNDGCEVSDFALDHIRVGINDGQVSGATFTNTSGEYSFFVQQPNITITPVFENASYFNITPLNASIHFPANDNSTQTQDFCMTANGLHPDVEIVIAPIGSARPGFDSSYILLYKNKGNQVISGNISFSFNDDVLGFISSSQTLVSQSAGLLTFNYSNLRPFESRSIYLTFRVNAPTETPPVNIDDLLLFSAAINPVAADETPEDNIFEYVQTVVGSFDPNDKQCIEGSVVSPSQIGKYLHYVINFENTGTYPAENVVIKDIINESMFDLSSLQVMYTSAPAKIKMIGNRVEFLFEGIHLPIGGHGNVMFKIKTRSDLQIGSEVENKADIFFDYNFPIVTDPAITRFETLSTIDFSTESIKAYPNPASNFVQIQSKRALKLIELYDIQGRLLVTKEAQGKQVFIDISAHNSGLYLLKVISDKGTVLKKIMKK